MAKKCPVCKKFMAKTGCKHCKYNGKGLGHSRPVHPEPVHRDTVGDYSVVYNGAVEELQTLVSHYTFIDIAKRNYYREQLDYFLRNSGELEFRKDYLDDLTNEHVRELYLQVRNVISNFKTDMRQEQSRPRRHGRVTFTEGTGMKRVMRCDTCHKFKSKQGCKHCAKQGGSIKSTIKSIKKYGLTSVGSRDGKLIRYRYTGPFNSLDNDEPINRLDAYAKQHDEAYDRLGKQAYWKYSNADDRLIRATDGETGRTAKIVRGIFKTKKKINEVLGIKPLYDEETAN